MSEDSAAERKRKRLEAWKKKRQQAAAPAPVKVSLSLNVSAKPIKKKKKFVPPPPKSINPFGAVDDDDEDDGSEDEGKKGKLSLGLGFSLTEDDKSVDERPAKRRKGRWDSKASEEPKKTTPGIGDTLEKFMDKLQAGAMGSVVTQVSESTGTELLAIDVGGSMMRIPKLKQTAPPPLSGGVITPEELAKISSDSLASKPKQNDPEALYNPSDWESDDHNGAASASDVSCLDSFLNVSQLFISHISNLSFHCIQFRPKQKMRRKKKRGVPSLKP